MAMSAVDFAAPASAAELEGLAEKLRERNFEVVIVRNGAEAKAEVLKRIPEGAVVHSGKSKTLEDAGLFQELMGVGTKITRTLILERDFMPGRTTILLVREPIGV